jgi:hypothetical protein
MFIGISLYELFFPLAFCNSIPLKCPDEADELL